MQFILSSLEFGKPVVDFLTFLLAFTAEAVRVIMRQNRPLLEGWVTLGLSITLKSYVYRQHLYTFR